MTVFVILEYCYKDASDSPVDSVQYSEAGMFCPEAMARVVGRACQCVDQLDRLLVAHCYLGDEFAISAVI